MNKCHACSNVCEPSWMVLKNDGIVEDTEETRAPNFIHYCSYLCRANDTPNLPRTIWHLVQNKEDFNKDPRPITLSQKAEFQYLTYREIQKLTDIEKEEYCQQKDKQIDWDKTKFYDDMELEDKYISQMENKDFDDYDDYDDY